MIITIQHLHSVPTWNGRQGFCHRASREFFQRHNLNWFEFLNHGIDERLLVATGDDRALTLVQHAHAEAENGQQ
ncbi:MAG: hypothetical protein CVV07_01015 [Gammaproteobacteria bacterium HGW-Gammaproteobacteria-11]|nr:MAG: hypothetical protein CVV07_01015 [Gammaproteobacteria bacterium HGW-Gammaproteobacteria-11]